MNKLWIGSIYYFLNVILHLGAFGVLFFVMPPEQATAVEFVSEYWLDPEGRALILLNSGLLIVNLAFALSILFIAPRFDRVLILMTIMAWLGLLLAFYVGTAGLVAYAGGAIHLAYFSYNKFKTVGSESPS